MSRHYSIHDFFRRMPPKMLARYFERRGQLQDFDFGRLKEGPRGVNRDALLAAWFALPDEVREPLEAEIQQIDELSGNTGRQAIIDEADWQHRELLRQPEKQEPFVEMLASLSSDEERAMVTFLDYNDFWYGALRFNYADGLRFSKRQNMGNRAADVDEASVNGLARLIGDHFHLVEGRGRNCKVECLKRAHRDYFFAYPEDSAKQAIEWERNEFTRRLHNVALSIVYIYDQAAGTLDLSAHGPWKKKDLLYEMFGKAILKLDRLPTALEDKRVYELDHLAQGSFEFTFAADSMIKSVEVRLLRLTRRNTGERVTLEANTPERLKDLLEEARRTWPDLDFNVSRVELEARIADGDHPLRTRRFGVGWPNSCSLKYDGVDGKLRAILIENGIEPKSRPQANGAAAAGDA